MLLVLLARTQFARLSLEGLYIDLLNKSILHTKEHVIVLKSIV